MRTSLLKWLLMKLKIPSVHQVLISQSDTPEDTQQDNFLFTNKHARDECIDKINDAIIRGKDKTSKCRNLYKLDGEYINLSGQINDKVRAECINRYLPKGMKKIKPTDLPKARKKPMLG